MAKKIVYPFELIGKEISLLKSTNPACLNLRGKVVDETKETIKLKLDGEIKTLLKKTITFQIVSTGQIIAGREITKRPEERLKGR
ncbi:MAG TPA: ribonuclease P protein subunit [Candidatus Nanoarchaeia archaeon]|nr:ribonuclease P protein subunit [Candidatus Nanoarchaeia archaeon]